MPKSRFNQAAHIANMFGGRRKLAAAIQEKPHTVDYWCRRTGVIPEEVRPQVLVAAKQLGVPVTALDFIRHLVSEPPIPAGAE